VCVGAIGVFVLGLHVQAFTPEIVRLVVSYALEYCRCTGILLDLVAAIGNTGVLEVLQLGPHATTFGRRKSLLQQAFKGLGLRGKRDRFVCWFLGSGTRSFTRHLIREGTEYLLRTFSLYKLQKTRYFTTKHASTCLTTRQLQYQFRSWPTGGQEPCA
jgi:hypothetical protein